MSGAKSTGQLPPERRERWPLPIELKKVQRRVRRLEEDLLECALVVRALRAIGLDEKRFKRRLNARRVNLTLVTADLRELESAARDDLGYYDQVEYVATRRLKHGVRHGGHIPIYSRDYAVMRSTEKRRVQRAAIERLAKLGLDVKTPKFSLVNPLAVIRDAIIRRVERRNMLAEELQQQDTSQAARRYMRREIGVLSRDLIALGGNFKT